MDTDSNKYLPLAEEIAELVNEKDKAYGSAFELSGKIVAIMYPNGVMPEQYNNLLVIVRMIDKLIRKANSNGPDSMGEDPFLDILGYALLAVYNNQKKEEVTHE